LRYLFVIQEDKAPAILKKKIEKESLTDLTFDNRNKDYGAFPIIKNSVRRLKLSFLAATIIYLLFILITGGGIRLPWVVYTDVYQNFNTVSVKYDPTLITILSEPSAVIPKKDKKKVFTEPEILDETKEIVAPEESKPSEDKLARVDKDDESVNDSLNKIAKTPEQENIQAARTKADSIIYIEQMPQFPGGYSALKLFISSNLKYPADAINRKVQGIVMISFIVEKDGSIKRIIITKAVDPVVDFEAVRIIASMPHWKPASNHGKLIAAMIMIPVNFSLQQ
jgi:periplasmic protein TonB